LSPHDDWYHDAEPQHDEEWSLESEGVEQDEEALVGS